MTVLFKTPQAVFIAVANETNVLAAHPRFYNAITENCTNVLAGIINKLAPGTLSWSLSWYLTGSADTYLIEQGFIKKEGSDAEMRRTHNLLQYRAVITGIASDDINEFSQKIRELLQMH
jgi:hypothetical protein